MKLAIEIARISDNFGHMLITLAPFGCHFCALGPFWEEFGCTFGVKKRVGTPKVPQEHPKAITPEINSSIWTLLEIMGCLLRFEKRLFFLMRFWSIFWVVLRGAMTTTL